MNILYFFIGVADGRQDRRHIQRLWKELCQQTFPWIFNTSIFAIWKVTKFFWFEMTLLQRCFVKTWIISGNWFCAILTFSSHCCRLPKNFFNFCFHFMFWSMRSNSTLCICNEFGFLLRSLFLGWDHIIAPVSFVDPLEWAFLCNQMSSSFVDPLLEWAFLCNQMSFVDPLTFSSPLKFDLLDLFSSGTPGKS